MRMLRGVSALLIGALLMSPPAWAGSTVQSGVPATGAPFQSAAIRNNFAAAANDINNILQLFAGPVAPVQPFTFQLWMNTAATPAQMMQFDGSVWVEIGTLDPVAHVWAVNPGALSSLGTAATKNASGSGSTVASVTGAFTVGDAAVFADPAGTIKDAGGLSGSGTVTTVAAGAGEGTAAGTCGSGSFTTSGTISSCHGINAQTGTTYAVQNSDQAKLVTLSNASPVAASLPQAGASSAFLAGWYAYLVNEGAGLVTITPTTSTIDGATSTTLPTGSGLAIFSDGTNYFTQRGAASGGTVTTASIVSANGFAGTIASPTTTPAITLSTTITGLLKADGTALLAAMAGTDYLAPSGSGAALTGLLWSQIGSTPTTLSGYGIVGAATSGNNSNISGLSGLTTPLSATQGGTGGTDPNIAYLDVPDQPVSGGVHLTSYSIGTKSSGTYTIDCGNNPHQYLLNAGAFNIAAPANDSNCFVQIVNGPSAGTVTPTGFSASPSGSGDTFATANTTSGTVTISDASPAVITQSNNFVPGTAVYFTTSGSLPTGISANTIYYVISAGLSTSSFEISATPAGSAINTSTAGSGTQTGHEPSVFTLDAFRINGLPTAIWKQQQ